MHQHIYTQQKIGWAIFLNVIITVSEYIGGIISGSLALISDAGHNLGDVLSLIFGYLGEKISVKKANNKHTFGFKRFELITSLINALSLIFIGFYIIYEGYQRFIKPETIVLSVMIGVGLIGLLGNFLSIFVLHKEKDKNMNMKAAYMHLFYDTISSIFVIFSGIIIYFTKFYMLDIIVSIIISIMILWSGFNIFKQSFHLIMEGVPEGINLEEVIEEMKAIPDVKEIHNLKIWAVNSNENYLLCHICSDTTDTDKLIETINKKLKKFKINNISVQIERNNLCENLEVL